MSNPGSTKAAVTAENKRKCQADSNGLNTLTPAHIHTHTQSNLNQMLCVLNAISKMAEGRKRRKKWGRRFFFHGLYKASSGHDFHEITV